MSKYLDALNAAELEQLIGIWQRRQERLEAAKDETDTLISILDDRIEDGRKRVRALQSG